MIEEFKKTKASKLWLSMVVVLLLILNVSYVEAKSLKKGEEYKEKSGNGAIRVVSSDEVEINHGGADTFLGKYTIDGERVRVVIGVLGATMVQYYKITPDGLVEEKGGAIYYSNEAMGKKRQEFNTYLEEGRDYQKKGQYDQAIERFSKAIALGASDEALLNLSRAYAPRGVCYAQIGQYGKAIEDVNKDIALGAPAYNIRGYIYAKAGQYDKAIEDVNKDIARLQNHPTAANHPDYNYGIARTYSLMDNKAIACKYLSKAIDNGYKDWDKIKKDSDLNKIRNSDCYKKIMEGK